MTKISAKHREVVREELASIGRHLMKSCGMTAHQARDFINEMVGVSV